MCMKEVRIESVGVLLHFEMYLIPSISSHILFLNILGKCVFLFRTV